MSGKQEKELFSGCVLPSSAQGPVEARTHATEHPRRFQGEPNAPRQGRAPEPGPQGETLDPRQYNPTNATT